MNQGMQGFPLLPAVLGEAPPAGTTFTAARVITAPGKALILNPTGTVQESVISGASGTAITTFNASKTSSVSICYDPLAKVYAIFYLDTLDGAKGKVILATVSAAGIITYGAPTVFAAAAMPAATVSLSSCYDPVTAQIIVAYARASDGFLGIVAATISGETVTFGATLFPGNVIGTVGICYDKSVSRVLINFLEAGAQKCLVVQVSGTSIVYGAIVTAVASGIAGETGTAVHCESLLTNAIAYNAAGRGHIRQVKIDPVTFAPSVGTDYTITDITGVANGYITGDKSLAWVAHLNRLAVIFEGGTGNSYALMVGLYSSSGTAWAVAASAQVAGTGFSAPYQHHRAIAYSSYSECLGISYADVNAAFIGKWAFSGTLTATSIAFGSAITFQNSASDMTTICANEANAQVIVAAWDNGNPTPAADLNGTAAVATAPTSDKRTQFIGFSGNAAAIGETVAMKLPFSVDVNQVGLTPNSLYYLSSANGSTLTTTVNGPAVARALSATSILVLGTNVFP